MIKLKPIYAKSNIVSEDIESLIRSAPELLSSFANQKIFVTGGTGFFGTWLLHVLLAAEDTFDLGLKIHVLSRDPKAFLAKNTDFINRSALHFIQGDVRNFEFPDIKIDSIIHAATEASASLNADDPGLMLDTIIAGTQRTLDFAIHVGAKKMLVTSSGGVYNRAPTTMTHIPEDFLEAPDPLNTKSAYGEGKRVSELMSAIYHRKYGLEVKVARCFGFVGPYFPLNTHYAIGNFIRDVLDGREIFIAGDGAAHRSFMYTSDLVEWLLTILQKGECCRPYHVGSDCSVSIAELADIIVSVGREMEQEFPGISPKKIRIAKMAEPGQLVERYVPQTTLGARLGLNCRYSLREGIKRTFLWNLENMSL